MPKGINFLLGFHLKKGYVLVLVPKHEKINIIY